MNPSISSGLPTQIHQRGEGFELEGGPVLRNLSHGNQATKTILTSPLLSIDTITIIAYMDSLFAALYTFASCRNRTCVMIRVER